MVILFLYAIGACILSGLFPVGDSKDLTTLSAKIHGVGSVLGFMVLTMCPFVISLLSFREKELSCGILSLVFFVGAIFFFVLFVIRTSFQYSYRLSNYRIKEFYRYVNNFVHNDIFREISIYCVKRIMEKSAFFCYNP